MLKPKCTCAFPCGGTSAYCPSAPDNHCPAHGEIYGEGAPCSKCELLGRRADHHVLEFAALAADIGPVLCYEKRRNCLRIGDRDSYYLWRPLTNASDAMALQEKLSLAVMPHYPAKWVAFRPHTGNGRIPCDTPIRAIALAACAIGEQTGTDPSRMTGILARLLPE